MSAKIHHLNKRLESMPVDSGVISREGRAKIGKGGTIIFYRPGKRGIIECADYQEALDYIEETTRFYIDLKDK